MKRLCCAVILISGISYSMEPNNQAACQKIIAAHSAIQLGKELQNTNYCPQCGECGEYRSNMDHAYYCHTCEKPFGPNAFSEKLYAWGIKQAAKVVSPKPKAYSYMRK